MNPFRVYLKDNVLEAAKKRIAWIFDEFPNVVTTTSGGKDSVVNFHLTLEVARKKNRLPVNVLFLDQEIEWQGSISIVRGKMEHPDVRPLWMQIPFRLFNSSSATENWLHCWDPAKEHLWMRPKESYSFKENVYRYDRFNPLLTEIPSAVFNRQPVAVIGGVRCEESPSRTLGLTKAACYKWVTWGKVHSKRHNCYQFNPLYDWHTSDVWKAIHEHGWPYNPIYDAYHQYGMGIKQMRISNFHHETSIQNMFVVQEVEPETYNRAVNRLAGLDSAAKFGFADFFPRELPGMFGDWKEYRDYLLENMIQRDDWKVRFRKRFAKQDAELGDILGKRLWQVQITSILTNDWEGIKTANFDAQAAVHVHRHFRSQAARNGHGRTGPAGGRGGVAAGGPPAERLAGHAG
jgi:predicted phosphoadenosine phosphosulfate sulfurtransferase